MREITNRRSMGSGIRAGAAALLLAFAAGGAFAADGGANPESGLPFFDVRNNQIEQASVMNAASLAAWHATPAGQKFEANIARLQSQVEFLRVDEHSTLGTAQYVRSLSGFLTAPSKNDAKSIVKGWVDANIDLLGINSGTLDASPLSADFVTHGGLMTHFTWQQAISGIDLWGCELRASVTGNGELINVGNTMLPLQGVQIPAAALTDLQALRAAAANVGIAMTVDPVAGTASGPAEVRTWTRTAEFGNQDPIETRRVFFPRTRDTIVPAWYVVVPEPGVGNTYEMVIDATNGDVLWRHNRLVWDTTQPATYRVYTTDSPRPGSPGNTSSVSSFQFPEVPRTLVTVNPGDISPFSPNGWINDGGNTTTGNNVRAYTDAANDNTADAADFATGTAAPGRVFDFPMNLTTDAPATYRDAAITQLFYYSNRYHDRLFAMGFDEAARNFQVTNFVTGTGNDPVLAEAQDGSGTNNANFGTSGTDGSNARCQMYVFTGPTPDRDGDFDGDVVYHELSHGLSIRLHRGGLTGTQGGGMGEGWGDFFAICLNAEPTDNFAAVYPAGAYATYLLGGGTANYYYGIRRYPYCADMTKSPLTYADVDNAQYNNSGVPQGPIGSATANEVHNVGEIWCQALLECRNEMAAAEGFNANQIIMQLAVDGMKLAPSAPNFLQERDAILSADQTRYGGIHQAALWRGFAKRGMGFSATSPTGGSTSGVVEAFDTPQRVTFAFPDGTPSVVAPGVPTTFRVTMTPEQLTITPGTQQLFLSVNGSAFTPLAMTLISGSTYSATIPAQNCFANLNYYVSTGTSAGAKLSPLGAPATTYSAQVITGVTTLFTDSFETSLGWTAGQPGDTATTGIWNRGDPEATIAQPGDDHTPAPGTLCFVTNSVAGAADGTNDVDGGFTTLLSPALPLAGHSNAIISYWRWYSNSAGGAPNADTFRVEISANGSTNWVNFETVGPTGAQTSGGWYQASRRVGDMITPTNATRIRFIAEDAGTGSLIEAAVDDVVIQEFSCVPPLACDPDVNQDGNTDQGDVDYLINVVAGGANPSGIDPDFNHDGNADQADVDALINVIAGGACP